MTVVTAVVRAVDSPQQWKVGLNTSTFPVISDYFGAGREPQKSG